MTGTPKKSMPGISGPGLIERKIQVRNQDVLLVRSHLEASDGLGLMFAVKGGDLTLVTTESQAKALDEFIADLAQDFPVVLGHGDG
jgi:hypothetical protein